MAKRKQKEWGDLSPDEVILSRKLQAWFDLEQEELPPLYLETLHEQIAREAARSADSLEERISQRVFARLGLEKRASRKFPLHFSGGTLAFVAGLLTLLLLVGAFLYFPPIRRGAQSAVAALLQATVQPSPSPPVQIPRRRSFATIWEAQPYVEFPIVHLRSLPAGFRLEEVQVQGSSAVALIYRRTNQESGRWERLLLLEYKPEPDPNQGTPFPTPYVNGPERAIAVDGMDVVVVQHEGTPDAEGTAKARWSADGILFCLYGPLSTGDVQALAGDSLQSLDK
jgi:hypothetical protein